MQRRFTAGPTGWRVASLALVVFAGSCASEPGGWVRESGDIGSRGGAVSVFEAYGDVAGPTGPGEGEVGAACSEDGDCVTEYCMTTQGISPFIKGAVVPGGYCSSLFCELDGSDRKCTEAMGGLCFSLYAFLPSSGEQGICLRPCDENRDCRTEDDNVCFDAAALVADGLLPQEVIDRYYAGGARGCMPESVVAAAIATLSKP